MMNARSSYDRLLVVFPTDVRTTYVLYVRSYVRTTKQRRHRIDDSHDTYVAKHGQRPTRTPRRRRVSASGTGGEHRRICRQPARWQINKVSAVVVPPVSERAPCLRHSAEVIKLARRLPGHLLRAGCQRLQGSVPRTARSCLACVSMRRTARPCAAGYQIVPRASAQHVRWEGGEILRSRADWCFAPRDSEKNPNDEVPRPVRPYAANT